MRVEILDQDGNVAQTVIADPTFAEQQWPGMWREVAEPPQTPTAEEFDAALTTHLDATAQQRRYDNRITCMVRAGFPGPFQSEAVAFATWADTCNAFAYQLMADVAGGSAEVPASTAAFIAMLPPMVWPT